MTPAEKQITDTEIIKTCLDKYKHRLNILDLKLLDLDKDTKEVLFHVITSFCDKFYYDDLTGETLFTKNILKNKRKKKHSSLLLMELKWSIIVSVFF